MPKPINISASRGASILGLSSWRTPIQTWLEIMESREPGFCAKHNYELPVFEESAAIRWGKAFESAIIELAEQKQGRNILDRERFYLRGEYLTCHIDGLYCDKLNSESSDNSFHALHEGKTTSEFYFREHFGEPGTDQVPIEYQIQCQHQMICTGAEKVILSVLVFPKRPEEWEAMGWIIGQTDDGFLISKENDPRGYNPTTWAESLSQMGYFHQYEITANPELQKLMIEKYQDFWNNNVLTSIPPEYHNYDDVRALVREQVGTIIADENIERLASEYKNITQEIGASGSLAKRKDQIRVDILKYMIDQDRNVDKIKDDDSMDKYILRSRDGKKLFSYNGKIFR